MSEQTDETGVMPVPTSRPSDTAPLEEPLREEPVRWREADPPPDHAALDAFWTAVKRLPKYLKLVANMARDHRVPAKAKAALAIGGIYTVSPVDLVPGVIPVAGQLDDLVVLLLAIRTAVRACPPELAAAHLERAGLRPTDFDADMAAVKDTATWLAAKGLRASRTAAVKGGRLLAAFWQDRVRPALRNR